MWLSYKYHIYAKYRLGDAKYRLGDVTMGEYPDEGGGGIIEDSTSKS